MAGVKAAINRDMSELSANKLGYLPVSKVTTRRIGKNGQPLSDLPSLVQKSLLLLDPLHRC